jgi:hypothetical protein
MKNTHEGVSLDIDPYIQPISLDMKPEKKAYHTERIRLNTEAPKEESPNNAIDEKSNFIMRYKEKNRIGIRKSAANDIALLALRDYVNQKREELANKKRNVHKYYEQLKVAVTETEEKPILFGLFKYQERKYSKGDIDRMREKYNQMKADYLKEDMDFKALCRASGVEVWGNSLDEIEANLDAIKRLTTEHEIKMQLNAMISPSKDVSNPYKAKVTQEVESNISMRYSPSTYTPSHDFNM